MSELQAGFEVCFTTVIYRKNHLKHAYTMLNLELKDTTEGRA